MTENCDRESQHDAELVVKKTRHDSLIAWKWSDGRKTLTPTEHEEMTTLIKEAETRCDPREYDSGDVIARVWLNNDETIRNVRWADDA